MDVLKNMHRIGKSSQIAGGAVLLGGIVYYISNYLPHHNGHSDVYKPTDFSEGEFIPHPYFFRYDKKQVDGTRPSIGIGLSGGGRKLTAHIGALRYYEKHLLLYDGYIPFELITKSGGSITGGIYSVLLDKYLRNPDIFEGRLPSQELERIVVKHQDVLKPDLIKLLTQQGAVNISKIDEFLKRIFEDRNFYDNPNLYIVAHKRGSKGDIVFGDERKDTPIWIATRASISWTPHIPPVDLGDCIGEDGGFLRASPLNELYSHKYLNRRIIVHLSLRTTSDPTDKMHEIRGFSRLDPFAYLRDLERRGAPPAYDRELRDFSDDLERNTNMTLEEVLSGKKEDLIIVAPELRFTTLFRQGLPLELISETFARTKEATENHAKQNEKPNRLIQFPLAQNL